MTPLDKTASAHLQCQPLHPMATGAPQSSFSLRLTVTCLV